MWRKRKTCRFEQHYSLQGGSRIPIPFFPKTALAKFISCRMGVILVFHWPTSGIINCFKYPARIFRILKYSSFTRFHSFFDVPKNTDAPYPFCGALSLLKSSIVGTIKRVLHVGKLKKYFGRGYPVDQGKLNASKTRRRSIGVQAVCPGLSV